MKLKIKKIHPDAKIPHYAHQGDAGFDLFVPESVTLDAQERKSIPLGLAVEIPDGYAGLLLDKSGLSHKHGLKSFGGVIDSGYRGEIHAGIMNLGDKPYILEKGHKIIQMLIMPVQFVDIEEADELSNSERGEGAFGSSGK
ncbi:MAG: dUTP diphosphatase [Patescibacteria group bacterium]